jgi:hypothetical protein
VGGVVTRSYINVILCAMHISNSYIRAFAANLMILVAFVIWQFCSWGGPWDKYHATVLEFGTVLGLITTLLVGTIIWKIKKPLPFWFFGFASLICWFAIFILLLWLFPHAGDLMEVLPGPSSNN